MHLDAMLFSIGGVLAVIALLFAGFLLITQKRGREIKVLLKMRKAETDLYSAAAAKLEAAGSDAEYIDVLGDGFYLTGAGYADISDRRFDTTVNLADLNIEAAIDADGAGYAPDDGNPGGEQADGDFANECGDAAEYGGDDIVLDEDAPETEDGGNEPRPDDQRCLDDADDGLDSGDSADVADEFDSGDDALSGGDGSGSGQSDAPEPVDGGADAAVDCPESDLLDGRFIIERELGFSSASRAYLARDAGSGAYRIVKYVQDDEAAGRGVRIAARKVDGASEIIETIGGRHGRYTVEGFVDGIALDKLVLAGIRPNEAVLAAWMEQLAGALAELAADPSGPIYHHNIKPSNILLTPENKLVLIDFQQPGHIPFESGKPINIALKCAAPEQLSENAGDKERLIIELRFGQLPEGSAAWQTDGRTDIYCLGAVFFELATGQPQSAGNIGQLDKLELSGLRRIIAKCLQIRPGDRFQSAAELRGRLAEVGETHRASRLLPARLIGKIAAGATAAAAIGCLCSGAAVMQQENMAFLDASPSLAMLSVGQSCPLEVEKVFSYATSARLDDGQLSWRSAPEGIAEVGQEQIHALSPGSAVLRGSYRQKEVSVGVRVLPDSGAPVSLRYDIDRTAQLFAGSNRKAISDGARDSAGFREITSIDAAADGAVYLVDDGYLRVIYRDTVDTLRFEPSYLSAAVVRCGGGDVYLLTTKRKIKNNQEYRLLRLDGSETETIYEADGAATTIIDFAVTRDKIVFIERYDNTGLLSLKSVPLDGSYFIRRDTAQPDAEFMSRADLICRLPDGTGSLSVMGERIYFTNSRTSELLVYDGELSTAAGSAGSRGYRDGDILFNLPLRVKCVGNYVYVWDGNVVRRFDAENGVISGGLAIAGAPVADAASGNRGKTVDSFALMLPDSPLADIAAIGGHVYIADPRRGEIWLVN